MHSRLNPYKILGISPYASEIEIKKAYYRLSREHHPDKKPAHEKNAAEAYFKKIVDAYEILTKPKNFVADNFYHQQETSGQAIIPYQFYPENALPYDNVPRLDFSQNNKSLKDINFGKNWERLYKIETYAREIKRFKKYLKKFQNTKTYEIPYNSEHLDSLDNEKISEMIESAEKKYSNIPDCIHENASLWLAEKEGCAPVYLLGTAHININDGNIKDRFSDVFDHLADQVDVVYTEVEMGYLYESDTITMDSFIAIKAHQQGKELRPLENRQVRLAAYNISEKEYMNYHQQSYSYSDREYQDFVFKYLSCGRLTSMDSSTNPQIKGAIKRGFFWMDDILFQSQIMKKTTLRANGYGHNSGQYGLPNLLAREGYKLTPLLNCAPETRKNVVRKLFFGNNNSFFQRVVIRENKKEQMQIIPYKI